MKAIFNTIIAIILLGLGISCNKKEPKQTDEEPNPTTKKKDVTAKDILGNPDYLAISYGGYRAKSRDEQPTVAQIKEDMKILSAIGVKVLRTYNVQLQQAPNILKAITELKKEDSSFEMYVMLGAWIDCKNAWTDQTPDHNIESEQNEGEIGRAVALANQYPDIVKIVAVGNEAMVKWAASYYVQPSVILKWVNHLQNLKKENKLPTDLWITSSDDFASWGGADDSYHTEDLTKLVKAVDYVSMHTYAYHNSHYNPGFWRVPQEEAGLSEVEKADKAMLRAKEFAMNQYKEVSEYIKSLGADKPIHIGETGWASVSDGFYGPEGSRATDEYKQSLYHKHLRDWTNSEGISCFYFEAFDEQWKDAGNPVGSENHFGLFTLKGEAKYPLWDLVDKGIFEGLTRDGNPITKTYGGDKDKLMSEVKAPPAH
ncbi:MAG: exo-beta-1,3-glucanase (GH17 family) [Arenicella sp.]|jgi:exo-beta-1,3-glucanase (GH17 family)